MPWKKQRQKYFFEKLCLERSNGEVILGIITMDNQLVLDGHIKST